MADEPHAPCPACLGPVLRRKGEALNKWRIRLGCSARCSKKLQGRRTITNLPPKNCTICDIEFTIREDEGSAGFHGAPDLRRRGMQEPIAVTEQQP
jgi:hypothetical protein